MYTPLPLPMHSSRATATIRPSGWMFVALGSSSFALAMVGVLALGAIRSGNRSSDFEDHGYEDNSLTSEDHFPTPLESPAIAE